ncbi:MAG: FHA domain-containing protein [Thermoguttaceae bacterium]|nr:FHA domain-containing protein [Thermoguttaceae bacterium]
MDFLLVVHGKSSGTRFDLQDRVITIGRGQKCNIRILDDEISRRHAELRHEGKGWQITDLNSSNGLYVNGRKVTSRRIVLGDQIQLGGTVLRFTSTADSESRRPGSVDLLDSPDDDAVHATRSRKGTDTSDIFAPRSVGEADHVRQQWSESERDHLSLIYRTIYTISQTLDIDRLLNQIMERIFDWIQIDRGCFILYDQATRKLTPKAVKRKQGIDTQMVIRSSIINYVVSTKEFVSTTDTTNPRLLQEIAQQGAREAICVPMIGRYGLVGVLYVDVVDPPVGKEPPPPTDAPTAKSDETRLSPDGDSSPTPAKLDHYITREHIKLMFAIAHQVAMALEDTQYYSAMLQSERLAAVGQTVAVLSHHIKNILQGIEGGSYLIQKGLSNNNREMVQKGWGIVEKNQGRVSDLILDMLSFSKERQPIFTSGDINEILQDVEELLESRASDFEIKLVTVPDASIPKFFFDGEQIHRALMNIVSNAIDAIRNARALPENLEITRTTQSPPYGMIRMTSTWRPDEKTVRIIIDDNGPGIPVEQRADIFRPFYSFNKSGGTGLGLSIAQKITQEHNGRLTIAESPEKGARFLMDLPFIDKEPVQE